MGNRRFPELDTLRKREEHLMTRGGNDGRELTVVRNKISMSEDLIKWRLVLAMVREVWYSPWSKRHGTSVKAWTPSLVSMRYSPGSPTVLIGVAISPT